MRDNEGRCGVMRGDEGVMRGGECKCTVCCHLYSHKTSEATLLKTNCFIKNYEIQFKCKINEIGLFANINIGYETRCYSIPSFHNQK